MKPHYTEAGYRAIMAALRDGTTRVERGVHGRENVLLGICRDGSRGRLIRGSASSGYHLAALQLNRSALLMMRDDITAKGDDVPALLTEELEKTAAQQRAADQWFAPNQPPTPVPPPEPRPVIGPDSTQRYVPLATRIPNPFDLFPEPAPLPF